MNSIVFIVDSSIKIGTGHVMRCLELASQFRMLNFKVTFFSREMEGNINSLIKKGGYKVISFPSDVSWEENIRDVILKTKEFGKSCKLFVVDHYEIDATFESQLKAKGHKVVVIDDLANREHKCDVIIDQNYYHNFNRRYDKLVPECCKKLLGPEVMILRDEFRKNLKNAKVRDGVISEILVFYGGTDPSNETTKALQGIELSKYTGSVNVIVGQSNPLKESVKALCNLNENWNYYCQVGNISDFMISADLSLGAGGATAWERIYVGLPSLATVVAENQKLLTEHADDLGLLKNLGTKNTVKIEYVKEGIDFYIENTEELAKISSKCLSFFKGNHNEKKLAKLILEGIENIG